MNLSGVHHVAIICSDYERSKDFYVRILNLKIIAETFRAERNSYKLDLEIPGGTQVELFSFPSPPPRPTTPEAQGLRHLAFTVSELDSTITELQSHDVFVEPIRIDPLTGNRYTFFADPDGLPLELCEVKS